MQYHSIEVYSYFHNSNLQVAYDTGRYYMLFLYKKLKLAVVGLQE